MQQYQFKYKDATWEEMDDGVWYHLEDGHTFSTSFDYRFRNVPVFISGYYQDTNDPHDIRFMEEPSDLRAYARGEWKRVSVTPAE